MLYTWLWFNPATPKRNAFCACDAVINTPINAIDKIAVLQLFKLLINRLVFIFDRIKKNFSLLGRRLYNQAVNIHDIITFSYNPNCNFFAVDP
jgi:hypothetical protein